MEEESLVSGLKKKLEDENLGPEEKVNLLNHGLNRVLNSAACQSDGRSLVGLKSRLYRSGVLSLCVVALTQCPTMQRGNYSAAMVTLAQLTSSCCVGADPGKHSEAFHRLFLPSVIDALLSLAARLMRRAETVSLFRKVFDSVGWLLRSFTGLTAHVLSSVHYEHIQMSDDVTVSLLCVQMWIQTCTASSAFLSGLSDDSVLLLLNEAVGQLAVSDDSSVGGASVRLILLLANQEEARVQPLLLRFKGLDSLLDKDWRGRGFNQEVDQLIALIQSDKHTKSHSQARTERVRAACVIQAAWRSYQTRRRVKSLNRAVSALQRKYRARRKQQQQQNEARQWEEELKYQVCLRRQQGRRKFHQKQRQLMQQLPPDQVQSYLLECERRAAVVIQSFWRGFRERRSYEHTHRHTLTQRRAARILQRAVRRFLQKRRSAKVPPPTSLWIGRKGLTDSRRTELKTQVDEYISLHPSSRVSVSQCVCLHEEVQMLLQSELRRGNQLTREEQRMDALLAHTHTQVDLLREAPPLCDITDSVADSFLSPSGPVAARARDSHNATLQASRLPWWKTLAQDTSAHMLIGPAHLEEGLSGLFIGGDRVTF